MSKTKFSTHKHLENLGNITCNFFYQRLTSNDHLPLYWLKKIPLEYKMLNDSSEYPLEKKDI